MNKKLLFAALLLLLVALAPLLMAPASNGCDLCLVDEVERGCAAVSTGAPGLAAFTAFGLGLLGLRRR